MTILLISQFCLLRSWDSSAGIAMDYGLDVQRLIPDRGKIFLLRSVHTGSGAYPVYYPVGTEGSFPGGKVAGSWSWPLTSN
jgi:hypothetical protein